MAATLGDSARVRGPAPRTMMGRCSTSSSVEFNGLLIACRLSTTHSRTPGRSICMLKRGPLTDGSGKCALVEVIELATDRHAMGKSRDLDVRALQEVGDIMRRGLPIDSGIERKDDLRDRVILRARYQRLDCEILRANAVKRRKRTAQHVVARVERMGAFERPQIRK